jgi:hypothetical protein
MPVLEVRNPAAKEIVHVPRDRLRPQQEPAPVGDLPNPVTGMPHGLVRRPAGKERHLRFAPVAPRAHQPVMEAQEVQAFTTDLQVHDAGLGRFRLQTEPGQQTGQARERPFGLVLRPAHDDQVVGEPHQSPVAFIPCPVEPVQVDVAEQR